MLHPGSLPVGVEVMAQPPGETKDSQLLQDFLLDMDFDEFIPVNNFFSGYVQALDDGCQSETAAVPLPSITPFTEIFPHSEPRSLHQPAPLSHHADVGPAPLTEPLRHPHEVSHAAPSASPANAPPPQQQRAAAHGGGGGGGGGANSGNSSEHNNNGAAPRSRGRLKTERQQALNKAAQHRYRERKKAKALELEQAVACLKDKVDELSVVQREKEELQAKVDALEEKLVVKAADEVRTAAGASAGTASVEDATVSELVAQYHGNVVALRTFLSRNAYLEHVTDAHLKALPREHALELETLVQSCFNTCASVHQLMSDADVYSMIEASIDKAQTSFQGSPDHWHQLIASLQLDERTTRSARTLRTQYLDKVRDVYAERHELNLEAVKILLPSDVGGLSTAQHGGRRDNAYLQRHKESYRTSAIMQRLKQNLSAEQRALAEVDFLVYRKLFNALQAARCILMAYPHHCDVLSLLNALQGDEARS